MAGYVGLFPANTYGSLWNVGYDNLGFTASLKTVKDGLGNSSTLQVSTTGINCTGTFSIGGSAVAIGGAVTFSGAFATTFTVTAITSLTLPISGTLATLAGTEAFSNKTITSSTYNGLTVTTTTGTFTLTNAKTLAVSNTLTFAGTDSTTITFQGTDTYVGRATTDTLTNKTYDTAGTGNVFKINGTGITDKTGTGKVVLDTSAVLTTPNIGAATVTSLNGVAIPTAFDLVLQRVSTITGASSTGTTTIPLDDTIPQITEGTEFMTLAITPKSASSILVIEVVFNGGTSLGTPDVETIALYQDATANALAAAWTETTVAEEFQISLRHIMTSGTTSATTFRVRCGGNNASTITFNGSGGSRFYGGVMSSSIMITEYAA